MTAQRVTVQIPGARPRAFAALTFVVDNETVDGEAGEWVTLDPGGSCPTRCFRAVDARNLAAALEHAAAVAEERER